MLRNIDLPVHLAGWPNPFETDSDQKVQRECQRLKQLYLYEQELWAQGHSWVAGIDEAGRGPLAGPVVAAAVVLPGSPWLPGLDDSKKVKTPIREELAQQIKNTAWAWAIAVVDSAFIDQYNILQATKEAMMQAISALTPKPEFVLLDGINLPELRLKQAKLIRGDQRSASIAAASILAKVHRDQLMAEFDEIYPGYGFSRHKGYGTPEHLQKLAQLGPCAIHRYSFAPVRNLELGGDS